MEKLAHMFICILLLQFACLVFTLSGCGDADTLFGLDDDEGSIKGTWRIEEVITDDGTVSYPYEQDFNYFEYVSGVAIVEQYIQVVKNCLVFVDEIKSEHDDDEYNAMAYFWPTKFHRYLNSDSKAYSIYECDIDTKKGKIDFVYGAYDSLWGDDIVKYERNGNRLTFKGSVTTIATKVDRDFAELRDGFTQHDYSDLYEIYDPLEDDFIEVALDTPTTISLTGEKVAMVDLKAGQKYYIYAPELNATDHISFYNHPKLLQSYELKNIGKISPDLYRFETITFVPEEDDTYYIRFRDSFLVSDISFMTLMVSTQKPSLGEVPLTLDKAATQTYVDDQKHYFFSATLEADTTYYIYDYNGNISIHSDKHTQDYPDGEEPFLFYYATDTSEVANLTHSWIRPLSFTVSDAGLYYIKLTPEEPLEVEDVTMVLSKQFIDMSVPYSVGDALDTSGNLNTVLRIDFPYPTGTEFFAYTNDGSYPCRKHFYKKGLDKEPSGFSLSTTRIINGKWCYYGSFKIEYDSVTPYYLKIEFENTNEDSIFTITTEDPWDPFDQVLIP